MRQLKRQLLPLLLSVVFGALALQPVSIQAQSTPEDEPPFISGGLAWSPDGEMIAVGTNEGVWLHSADDLEIINQLVEQSLVKSLDWNTEGEQVVCAFGMGNIEVIDITTGDIVYNLEGHTHNVTSVAWSPNSTLIASISWDNTIRIWNSEDGTSYRVIELDSHYLNYALAWNPNSEQISTYFNNGEGGRLGVWNIETGALNFDAEISHETCCVNWSPNGDQIATGSSDNQIRLWNSRTGELSITIGTEGNYVIRAMDWSPDSLLLAINSSNDHEGTTQIWNTATAELLIELQGGIMTGDGFYTNGLAWSPDGSYLASVSDDGKIYLWDMETYEPIAVYEGYRSILRSD